jgi:hypothetical protein
MQLFQLPLKSRLHRNILLLATALLCVSATSALFAQPSTSIPEEIEWTWEVRPPHLDPKLPNVLLLGDSITRNYFPQVKKDLDSIANVYLMSSSTSVGDPRLPRQIVEFSTMMHVPFQVVHFNNGMHGWRYTEAQYKAAFPGFLRSMTKLVKSHEALIWATTTPVRPDASGGATNPRVDERNAIATSLAQAAKITVDDQHALMMQHGDLHQDSVHFNPEGANLQGDQAAETIKAALTRIHK